MDRVPDWLLNGVPEKWMSVVSVEYRFTSVATPPAQVNDCLRSFQYIRHNAAGWKIDPQRIGVTGGLAGGCLLQWLALHDDSAGADSNDPLERHSSRVACAVSFAGLTDWSLLGETEHRHPACRQLLGYEPGTPADEMDAVLQRDTSPISFVSQDELPVIQVHGDQDNVVPLEPVHRLTEWLKNVGVKTELVIIEGTVHNVSKSGAPVAERPGAFVRDQLLQP